MAKSILPSAIPLTQKFQFQLEANPGTILFLPTFSNPKVENPIFRGMKKGCLSFGCARRRKIAAGLRSAALTSNCHENDTAHTPVRNELATSVRRMPPMQLLEEYRRLYLVADERGANWMTSSLEFAVIYEKERQAGLHLVRAE
jgi:hypothetical protein